MNVEKLNLADPYALLRRTVASTCAADLAAVRPMTAEERAAEAARDPVGPEFRALCEAAGLAQVREAWDLCRSFCLAHLDGADDDDVTYLLRQVLRTVALLPGRKTGG